VHAGVIFEAVDAADVRMIERRENLRLAPEACEPIRVIRKGRRQHLDRDVAIELGVVRAIHLAHTADAELAVDAEYANLSTDLDRVVHAGRAAERKGPAQAWPFYGNEGCGGRM
jgi:hypothetical protein